MAKKRVNKYAKAFRQMALERLKSCDNVSALAGELGVHRTVLYHWRNQMEPGEDGAGPGRTRPYESFGKRFGT